jgi:hypothetical protein
MKDDVEAAIESLELGLSIARQLNSARVSIPRQVARELHATLQRQAATLRALTDPLVHYELTDGRSNQSDALGALFEIFGAVTWAEGELEKSAALAVGEQLQLECGVWIKRTR